MRGQSEGHRTPGFGLTKPGVLVGLAHHDYSLGASVGYLVMTNAWVSAGYNLIGFEDEDFSDASYTAEGPCMRFRMKFDQQSVKEAAAWLNR